MQPTTPLNHETLIEEARFVLATLLRNDLFGDRVRIADAERVLGGSISLAVGDYCGFLSKYGYIRVGAPEEGVEVTGAGRNVVQAPVDSEFHARLGRHFSRELGPSILLGSRREPPPPPPLTRLPPAQQAEPDLVDRRYVRHEAIGSGPVGIVFRAEHVRLGRPVAIKEARTIFDYAPFSRREEVVRRLWETVEMQARLEHPSIISVIDQSHEFEFPYVVTELAGGGNLRQRLARAPAGRFDIAVALRILLQLCYALDHAHSQGALHLSIKPENVLFDRFGNVKLADFGSSSVVEAVGAGPRLVGSGALPYMSPERLEPSFARLGPPSDIYGVGILAYQMLTGRLPGRRSPLPSAARSDQPIPLAFDDIFDRMTRDEVEERYPSVGDVLEGIYHAFPREDVLERGTVLFWTDPPPSLLVAAGRRSSSTEQRELVTNEIDASAFIEEEPSDEADNGARP